MIEVKEINSNCEKRGRELLAEAKEDHLNKKKSTEKDIQSYAKDGAVYLCNRGRSKITSLPKDIRFHRFESDFMIKDGFVRTERGWRKTYEHGYSKRVKPVLDIRLNRFNEEDMIKDGFVRTKNGWRKTYGKT